MWFLLYEKDYQIDIFVIGFFLEAHDPFTTNDALKIDPFAPFKTVSFADPFSSDPFEVGKNNYVKFFLYIQKIAFPTSFNSPLIPDTGERSIWKFRWKIPGKLAQLHFSVSIWWRQVINVSSLRADTTRFKSHLLGFLLSLKDNALSPHRMRWLCAQKNRMIQLGFTL